VIDNDRKAEWALKKIAFAERRIKERKEFVQSEIERLQQFLEAEIAQQQRTIDFMTAHLEAYFRRLDEAGATAGKKSYRLPTGIIGKRTRQAQIDKDDAVLVEWLKEHGLTRLVKVKESPDWAEFKKRLQILADEARGGYVAVTLDGEIVDAVRVVAPERDEFYVKVDGGGEAS